MKKRRLTLSELVVIILTIFGAAGVILPALSRNREQAGRRNCAGNLRRIGLGQLIYSAGNRGCFPELNPPGNNFEPLNTAGILTDGEVYACPSAAIRLTQGANSNYWYAGAGLKADDPAAALIRLAYDISGNHPHNRWMNCVFLDGHVEGARPDGSKTWNRYP